MNLRAFVTTSTCLRVAVFFIFSMAATLTYAQRLLIVKPSEKIIGHWMALDGKADYYFDGELIHFVDKTQNRIRIHQYAYKIIEESITSQTLKMQFQLLPTTADNSIALVDSYVFTFDGKEMSRVFLGRESRNPGLSYFYIDVKTKP